MCFEFLLESANFARPMLGISSRFRPHEDVSVQGIHERRDYRT